MPTLQADLLRAAAYLAADEDDDDSNTMPLSEALRIAGVLRALAATGGHLDHTEDTLAMVFPTTPPTHDESVRDGMGRPAGEGS